MSSNLFLLLFAIAFMGCVLATPMVTRIAGILGAIDRPDQFRRIHKGAIPRMGGLAVAFGIALCLPPLILGGYLRGWPGFEEWWSKQWAVVLAGAIILVVGVYDDTRGMLPKPKLLGQALAVLILFHGGIRITNIEFMGLALPLSAPVSIPLPVLGAYELDLPSLVVTLLWFLGCMNIWNLIDGMDGLASGVGLLVTGTLMLVALKLGNLGAAATASVLAGSLAGFLLYNWHPACIFLGDSGSLLIGLLIGVIGVQGSIKGTAAVSILFPILAMGLPISDTAMAIFRRWVRDLPLSSADRRHVHHLLIGLGLNPRQAAMVLYLFTAGLCGVVLLGVALRNEFLALILGLSGCLAFLLILTSRRDELSTLLDDLNSRWERKAQEREASKITWEAIQRVELCDSVDKIWATVVEASESLGSDRLTMSCRFEGKSVVELKGGTSQDAELDGPMGGPTATFRLFGGAELDLTVSLHLSSDAAIAADIAFRSLQRISLAAAQRLERLIVSRAESSGESDEGERVESLQASGDSPPDSRPSVELTAQRSWYPLEWLKGAFSWSTPLATRQTWYGDK